MGLSEEGEDGAIVFEAVRTYLVESLFAAVTERGVPKIMPEGDSFCKILVKSHAAGNSSRYLRDLKGVSESSSVVVAYR